MSNDLPTMIPQRSSLRPESDSPVGLVLSGGGARGAFQVGVWKVLREEAGGFGTQPDVVSGTSCGAINAALIAAGVSPDDMLEFWLRIADDPPVVANETFFEAVHRAISKLLLLYPFPGLVGGAREVRLLSDLFRRHRWWLRGGFDAMVAAYWFTARYGVVSSVLTQIPTPYVFSVDKLKDHLERAVGAPDIRGTDVRLAINTVDARTGKVVRFVNHPPQKHPRSSSRHYRYEPVITFDMILASAAIPLLFNPVRIGSMQLWDGGILVNSPLAPAVALGARRIVPVLVTSRTPPAEVMLDTFGEGMERVVDTFLENAYRNDRKLLLDRNALADRLEDDDLVRVELFRAIRPRSGSTFNAGSYLYFEREALLSMHEAGVKAARDWLDRGPELDSRWTPD